MAAQAAQTGKPRIVIIAPWLTDDGFDFWRDRSPARRLKQRRSRSKLGTPQSGATGEVRRCHATAHLRLHRRRLAMFNTTLPQCQDRNLGMRHDYVEDGRWD